MMGNPHRVEGEQIYQKDTDNTHAEMRGIPAVSETQVSRALFAHMNQEWSVSQSCRPKSSSIQRVHEESLSSPACAVS
jgi:hypothetical protein